jgi:hypothetical protein
MWKTALKTNSYHMLENQCFETRVKLFFAKFGNPAQVLKIWKKRKEKKNWVGSFKIVSYLDPAIIIKNKRPAQHWSVPLSFKLHRSCYFFLATKIATICASYFVSRDMTKVWHFAHKASSCSHSLSSFS